MIEARNLPLSPRPLVSFCSPSHWALCKKRQRRAQLWEIPTASSFSGICYGKQEHWEVLVPVSLLKVGVCRRRAESRALGWLSLGPSPTETTSSSTLRSGAGARGCRETPAPSPAALCRLAPHLQLSQKSLVRAAGPGQKSCGMLWSQRGQGHARGPPEPRGDGAASSRHHGAMALAVTCGERVWGTPPCQQPSVVSLALPSLEEELVCWAPGLKR